MTLPPSRIPAGVLAVGVLALPTAVSVAGPVDGPADEPVDFARDVRPILSDNCYACHGNDTRQNKASLRLDIREGTFGELPTGNRAVVPGEPGRSQLIWRVTAEDPDDRMPPRESGKSLSPEEIDVLQRWVEQGAPWKNHWSFEPPVRPASPDVSREDWPANAVDRFVLARLEERGLGPAPQASDEVLLRRVTYDLTGLPPTPGELDAFLADGAYERAVDRLLASPRFGEHMARYWLDAARFADTHGLHLDNERSMWRFREWVITAFNDNKPFDEFTIEQLAGDLLPDATLDDLIASGFNRSNPTSAEGGMIAEEYLALYAKDRVDTTSTVWMGLTMACTQCHEHKFDPFSQREYYQLFAFFNSLAEEASDRNIPNPVPFIRAPSRAEQTRLEELDAGIQALAAEVDAPLPEVDAGQVLWELAQADRLDDRWRILVPSEVRAMNGSALRVLPDDSLLVVGENPAKEVFEVRAHAGEELITALRLEALVGEGNADRVPGRASNQNFVLSAFELEAHPYGRPEESVKVPLGSAVATHSQPKYGVAGALDGDPQTGWGGLGAEGSRAAVFVPVRPFGFEGGTEVVVRLRHESRFAQHAIGRFRLAVAEDPELQASLLGPWSTAGPFAESDGRAALEKVYPPEDRVDVTSELWTLHPEYADGEVHRFENVVGAIYLQRTIDTPTKRTMRVGIGSDDGVRIWLNGELVHDNPAERGVAADQDLVDLRLRAGRNEVLMKVANYGGDFGFAFRRIEEEAGGMPLTVSIAVTMPEDERSPAQRDMLRTHYRREHAPQWVELTERLAARRTEREAFEGSLATTMISRDLEQRRPAHILESGHYDRPGEEVQPDVPALFPPIPDGAPRNRLGLATWLVSGEHPLTARVTVNRLWQQLFGTGLVETAEDFGTRGDFPSHPQLLDWLACEFVESGWDVVAMMRLLVTSRAYRQSSRVTPELLDQDPYNRLITRGPRFRLDGEMIRDTALFVSGLLVEDLGGPSVRPYQPSGVWKAVGYTSSNTANYKQDDGEALYRRSLYTFWKRTAPPPNMVAFDAPSREACTVRRARTNTPLQALVLLNDPQFVEAARHFARRALTEGGRDDAERVRWAFRCVTARFPTDHELEVLLGVLADQRADFAARPSDAEALLGVGDSPHETSLDAVEHAAWTTLAGLLLNLDETVTRG